VSIEGNDEKEKSDGDGKATVEVENSENVKGYNKAVNHHVMTAYISASRPGSQHGQHGEPPVTGGH
jgi:hypothetical protein